MRAPILAALTATIVLTSCTAARESRFNPFNWFGSSREQASTLAPDGGYTAQRDSRALVENVVSMRIDRTPEGAIVTAVGLPPTQGFWDGELVPVTKSETPENGVLAYDFRIRRPFERAGVVNQQSREVTVAHFISTAKLNGVRTITVRGNKTQRSSRR
jgi:hypothetical protein